MLQEYDILTVKSEPTLNVDRDAIVQNALKACNEHWHYLWGAEGEMPDDGTGYPDVDNYYSMPESGEVGLNQSNGKAYSRQFEGKKCHNSKPCENVRHTDCSGLVFWAYTNWNDIGLNTGITKFHLDRLTAKGYFDICKKSKQLFKYKDKKFAGGKQPQKGDLLFLQNKKSGEITHVGIIVSWTDSDKSVIHATNEKGTIHEVVNWTFDLWVKQYRKKYYIFLGDLVAAIQQNYTLKVEDQNYVIEPGTLINIDAGEKPKYWNVNGRKRASSYKFQNGKWRPIFDDQTFSLFMDNNYVIKPVWKNKRAALFKDDWYGFPANEIALNGSSYFYEVFNSSYFGSINLMQYNKVIIAGMQDQTFYHKVCKYSYWFDDYVYNGGLLEMHISPIDWIDGLYLPCSLGFHSSDSSVILDEEDAEHPLLNSPNILSESELFACGYFDGPYYIDVNYTNVIGWDYDNRPVWMEFSWGYGAVVATTIPMEWLYYVFNFTDGAEGSLVLENSVLYPEEKDISISVTMYKENFAEGYPILMNITAINRGLWPEVFSIEVCLLNPYDYKIPIAYNTTWLTKLRSFSFTLKISDRYLLDYINNDFILVVNVEPLSYETNIGDNSIFIAIDPVTLGNVNGDDVVDMIDVVTVIRAFGSYPTQPKWDPNCDINIDFKVDMRDIIITISQFGKTDP
jgi:cell wall-associated NlpC family hydrolase